jgi:hypothetical protein
MRNRLLISTMVHFLLGILFVFPVYSAENHLSSKKILTEIGYYGNENDDDDDSDILLIKNGSYTKSHIKALSALKNLGLSSFLPIWICEPGTGSGFLLKYSQQIVDISFLKCIRSVVIRC